METIVLDVRMFMYACSVDLLLLNHWREGISSIDQHVVWILVKWTGLKMMQQQIPKQIPAYAFFTISAWSVYQPPLNLWHRCFKYETKQNIPKSFGYPCQSMIQKALKKRNWKQLHSLNLTMLTTPPRKLYLKSRESSELPTSVIGLESAGATTK